MKLNSKLKDFVLCGAVTLLLSTVFLITNQFNDYMKYKQYNLTVTQLYSGASTGKHSSLQFIAVFKTENNVYFDRYISPSYYSTLKVGDYTSLSLRPMDVQQTLWDNVIWFFIAKVLLSAMIATGIIMRFISLCILI